MTMTLLTISDSEATQAANQPVDPDGPRSKYEIMRLFLGVLAFIVFQDSMAMMVGWVNKRAYARIEARLEAESQGS